MIALKKKIAPLSFALVSLLLCGNTIARAQNINHSAVGKVAKAKQPLLFMENKGQVVDSKGSQHPEILFLAKSANMSLFLNKNGITYTFSKTITPEGFDMQKAIEQKNSFAELAKLKTVITSLNMELVGANPLAEIVKEEKSKYYENYHTTRTSINNVAGFQKVTYKNVYPNIDWVVYSKENSIKYDFIVHPGGNPKDIKLKYSNPENIDKKKDGSVDIETSLGKITEQTPFVFQGKNTEIKSEFGVDNNVLSFSIGDYSSTQDLIIDPGIIWGMYFGVEFAWDMMYSCFEDNSGNLYTVSAVPGQLTGYPSLVYGQQATVNGSLNVMITKIDENAQPLWATYYGAGASTVPLKIRPDAVNVGSMLVTGTTNDPSLLMMNGFMNTYPGGLNAGFVSRWDANGFLLNSTYIGGTGDDNTTSIASDASGIYVCGKTQGLASSITMSGSQTAFAGGAYDGYVAHLDNNFNLNWATYIGGTGSDILTDIGIQINGAQDSLVVVGYTSSTTGMSTGIVPSSSGANYAGGANDGLITKFDKASGTKLLSRYFGGNADDKINALCIPEYHADAAHHTDFLFIAGETTSSIFADLTGTNAGGSDAFYAGGINIYVSGSYIGGIGYDAATTIKAFDFNLYVAGVTQGPGTSIATPNGFQINHAGSQDGFIKCLGGNTLSPAWGTYYGGDGNGVYSSDEYIFDIAINPHVPQTQSPYDFVTHLFAVGYSQGTSGVIYNNTNYNPNSFYDGTGTGIVAKFATVCALTPNPVTITTSNGTNSFCQGSTLNLNAAGADNFVWSGGTNPPTGNTYSVSAQGLFVATGTKYGCSFAVDTNIVVNPLPSVFISPGGSQYVCTGQTQVFTANSATATSYQWYLDGVALAGETNATLAATQPGSYVVEAFNAFGCSKSSFQTLLFVNSPPPAAIVALGNTTICQGQSVVLEANNSIATYNWFLDGNPIAGAFLKNLTVTQSGTYSVYETSPNGCDSMSNSINVTVLPYPTPTIYFAGIPYTCAGGTVQLNTSFNSNYTYQWLLNGSPISGATDTAYIASGNGNYAVTVTNNGVCSTTSSIQAIDPAPDAPAICLVTVDTASTHNIIIWEKPISTTIDSFRIYRETTIGVYSYIASVSYDSLSEYHDFGANPNVTSYKYKMAVVDICGQVSDLSPFHNTIHLQLLGNGNLQWTNYEIENQTNPVSFYRVYRDDTGLSNIFNPISATVPGGNSTWTDIFHVSFPNASYVMDVDWSIGCNPTRATINTTRSNIRNSALIGISEVASSSNFILYPNPATGMFAIDFGMDLATGTFQIIDLQGRVVLDGTIKNENKVDVNINAIANGVYMVAVMSEKGPSVIRLVKTE